MRIPLRRKSYLLLDENFYLERISCRMNDT